MTTTTNDDSRVGAPLGTPWRIAACVALLWIAVFAKVGSGLVFGIDDILPRVQAFPRLQITGNALSDYRNWSILPIALGRAFSADTARGFAILQATILLGGTVAIVAVIARRSTALASGAVVGVFATMVPSWLLYSMGTYDQLLIVLLLAATVADHRVLSIVLGLLLGLTHAEAAAVSLTGLALLSAAGVGPRVNMRYLALAGVVASRAALTVWFRLAGQSGDRFTFVSEFGLAKLLGFFSDTWPCIVWSAASGGWLIIASRFMVGRDRQVMRAIVIALALNLAATAVTADQSRVAMITTMPLVVVLAAFPSPHDARNWPNVRQFVNVGALTIGLLAPLTISWVGEVATAGDPFRLSW